MPKRTLKLCMMKQNVSIFVRKVKSKKKNPQKTELLEDGICCVLIAVNSESG